MYYEKIILYIFIKNSFKNLKQSCNIKLFWTYKLNKNTFLKAIYLLKFVVGLIKEVDFEVRKRYKCLNLINYQTFKLRKTN